MPVEKYSISLMPDIAAAVALRSGERSTTINRSLDRYFAILDAARRRLAVLLDDQEMGLILDVLNGTLFAEPFSIQLVEHEIADALTERDLLGEGYAEKWKVIGPELVGKLLGLTYPEQVALVDAVERWWNRVGAGESKLKPGEALKK
jgi:hypothetical protein